MQRQYSFDAEQPYEATHHNPQQTPYDPPIHSSFNPAAHPDSSFNRLRAARRYSRERDEPPADYRQSSPDAPAPPPHRDVEGRLWGQELGYNPSQQSNITPGADNFGEQASGGIAGIAMGVADHNARESGLEAMRNTPGYDPRMDMRSGQSHDGRDESYEDSPYNRPFARQEQSSSSLTPLGAAAFPPGLASPQARSTVSRSPAQSIAHEPYVDVPYNRYSRNVDPSMGAVDPNSIEDDGDDGLDYRRRNMASTNSLSNHSDRITPVAAGGAAAGGVLGTLGGMMGRKQGPGGTPAQYDPVRDPYGGPNNFDLGPEKNAWPSSEGGAKKKSHKKLWTILLVVLIIAIIIGGTAGGIVGSRSHGSKDPNTPQGASAASDTANNGDLNKDSDEIKKLMNNPKLHKVFPGMDYTPMYTQYPDCLSYPASQNNVTRDMAVLSQLTNTVRLYGTDCNQTELVLHAIDQLGLKGTVKLWMGVWQDTNKTTNARQIEQAYSILDKYGADPFVGVIVGNEVLFRKDMTIDQLGQVISNFRSNMTSKSISLPIASSDLGDDWTAALASEVDYVMANIHPFFAGVTAETAAEWTWNFWQTHDVTLKTDATKHIISETGWPSTGGTDCGGATSCTVGSVAGVTEMNTFMGDWICQALANGTNYFWFEAFDEPWKIQFNTAGKEWEDKWGMMDVNRNLKPGVVIPDCGGKTIS